MCIRDRAWGELGITVNINKVEWASFLPMRRAGDYDISRNGWSMDYTDPSNMLELFTTNTVSYTHLVRRWPARRI